MSDTSTAILLPRPNASAFALIDTFDGHAYPLRFGPNTVGRSPLSSVALEDRSVSRCHAVVTVSEEGTCEIRDDESHGGTYVGGWRQHAPTRLTSGELIRLGNVHLVFARIGETHPRASCFADPVFGLVVRNASDASWHFSLTIGQISVSSVYSTKQQPSDWPSVRERVEQLRAHEADIRARVGSGPASLLCTATGAALYYEGRDGMYCFTIDWNGPESPRDD